MSKKRLLNFELLRILSMLFIITGHLLGDNGGDLLGKQEPFTISWVILWAIEAFSVAGTNCFVLISGYFLVEHQFSWKKVLKLCLEVWFYSVVIYIICISCGIVKLERASLLQVFTPILGRTWWFISTYLGMYILSPYINAFIRKIDEPTHRKVILVCFLLFSVINTFYPFTDTFCSGGGSGIAWFITLYLIAAYIRNYEDKISIPPDKIRLIYIGSVGLMILSKYVLTYITSIVLSNPVGTSVFFSNCSVLNVAASVSLFLIFKNLKLETIPAYAKKAIALAGSVPFGVYILHNNPWISPFFWDYVNSAFYRPNILVIVLMVLTVPLAIYIVCGCIDYLRNKLFELHKTKP